LLQLSVLMLRPPLPLTLLPQFPQLSVLMLLRLPLPLTLLQRFPQLCGLPAHYPARRRVSAGAASEYVPGWVSQEFAWQAEFGAPRV
jgi:hypothetical protein